MCAIVQANLPAPNPPAKMPNTPPASLNLFLVDSSLSRLALSVDPRPMPHWVPHLAAYGDRVHNPNPRMTHSRHSIARTPTGRDSMRDVMKPVETCVLMSSEDAVSDMARVGGGASGWTTHALSPLACQRTSLEGGPVSCVTPNDLITSAVLPVTCLARPKPESFSPLSRLCLRESDCSTAVPMDEQHRRAQRVLSSIEIPHQPQSHHKVKKQLIVMCACSEQLHCSTLVWSGRSFSGPEMPCGRTYT